VAYPVSDPYLDAIRNGAALTYTVDASFGGSPVVGATGLAPIGGSITDTVKPGVRRTLSLDLAPAPGLYDLLAPIGTVLKVTAHVRFTDRTTVDIPMGVFSIDSQTLEEGGGKLSLTAPDRWVLVQRAKFIVAGITTPGMKVTDQIVVMIRDAIGPTEPVVVTASSKAVMSAITYDNDDRAGAAQDLAAGIGAWVFCDRNGTFTIADLPTLGPSADWLIDASASGVLTSLNRSRSRANTHNVVALESSTAASTPAFPIQYVWDSDPTSPTYAGPDPIAHPELAGPFGVSTYHASNPLPLSANSARATALTILAKTVGLASQVSLSAVPNPAIDAFDVLDVLPPGRSSVTVPGSPEIYPGEDVFPGDSLTLGRPAQTFQTGSAPVMERHVADTVTHPLDVTAPVQIDGRSTRTDPYS
jgi:hypothetical protein